MSLKGPNQKWFVGGRVFRHADSCRFTVLINTREGKESNAQDFFYFILCPL